MMTAERIRSYLKRIGNQSIFSGKDVIFLESTDSTNNCAKRAAEEGAQSGTLIAADRQTAGRGRSGRVWMTPKGEAVACSLILRPKLSPEKVSMVTLVMGLAVTETVRRLYAVDAGIKWPNDVVIGGKKLCGILTEMKAAMQGVQYIVIGVGINANTEQFPEEISKIATGLYIETGRKIDRAELIAEICACFEPYYKALEEDGDLRRIKDLYNERCLNADAQVNVLDPQGAFAGRSHGINDRGELIVEKQDGSTVSVYAGEVSVRGVFGYV